MWHLYSKPTPFSVEAKNGLTHGPKVPLTMIFLRCSPSSLLYIHIPGTSDRWTFVLALP
jgi:hypothetical protein